MRVSVLMPTYNRAGSFLTQSVHSFMDNKYSDCELIVVNDGSTDDTGEMIERFMHEDNRIKYFEKSNGGEASAVNIAIKNCTGQLCCTLYDDDLLTPNSIEDRAKAMEDLQKYNVEFIWTSVENIDSRGNVLLYWKATDYNTNICKVWSKQYIHMSGVMWKKSIIEKVGYYNESLWHYCDWDFLIKCLMECNCVPVDILSFRTRYHPDQKSCLRRKYKRDGEENTKMRIALNNRYKGIFQ